MLDEEEIRTVLERLAKGYYYHPHSSIPQALADFLEAQTRSISDACSLSIDFCQGTVFESQLAQHFKVETENMRFFCVEYTDGWKYQGYLICLDGDCWFIGWIDVFLKVSTKS